MKNYSQSTSSELQSIERRCSEVIKSGTSNAQNIPVLYRDKIGNVLTIIVPSNEEIISQLPPGGSYFIGII